MRRGRFGLATLWLALLAACAPPTEYTVLDRSMEDTLRPMERVRVVPATQVRRGDVIAYEYPFPYPGNPRRVLFGRVIGLPGDRIEVRKGTVLVNGQVLSEPYVKNQVYDSMPPVIVPEAHYFVLGDDRSNTRDSRVWGALPASKVMGLVALGSH